MTKFSDAPCSINERERNVSAKAGEMFSPIQRDERKDAVDALMLYSIQDTWGAS